jgi:hypothetical protein
MIPSVSGREGAAYERLPPTGQKPNSEALTESTVSRTVHPEFQDIDPYNCNHVADHFHPANPAMDLDYLLHKNPERIHSFELSCGKAHLCYPEATLQRCTAALLLDVDPVGLVCGKRAQHEGGTLDQYVNDRPHVLPSFFSRR